MSKSNGFGHPGVRTQKKRLDQGRNSWIDIPENARTGFEEVAASLQRQVKHYGIDALTHVPEKTISPV